MYQSEAHFLPQYTLRYLGAFSNISFFLISQSCIKPASSQHYTSAKERRGNKTFLPAPFAKLTRIRIRHCGTFKQPLTAEPWSFNLSFKHWGYSLYKKSYPSSLEFEVGGKKVKLNSPFPVSIKNAVIPRVRACWAIPSLYLHCIHCNLLFIQHN